ncbi:hypothetical protein [Bradyrhizobium embrapense]|uniref:hypothetical protein n=1 Tax=Bradyrhizobium embrapense TaxID=630921 RepID=UPI0007C502F2|nr:hypothetical protein [Bradyrhizobium embrapense]
MTTLGRGRRWGAIVLLRMASAVLRSATALYLKRTISAAGLRAALSVARSFERTGALIALGRRSRPDFTSTEKAKDHDGIE